MPTGFIKQSIEDFNAQQINFCSKIGNYNLDKVADDEIDDIIADAKYLSWEINTRKSYVITAHSWTNYGNALFFGADDGLDAIQPTTPIFEVAPPPVHPGMRTRFSNIAANCKSSTGFTKNIGIDLGILATVTVFVPANGKPMVTSSLHVGHPFFRYVKGEYEGVQIYKDRGDGKGFLKFDKAINPTYLDNTPLPTVGVAEVWKYKFVFLYKYEEVGTASAAEEILVTGM